MKTAFRFAMFTAASAFIVTSAVASETYKFDQSRSTVGFRVRHLLGAAVGKFKQFNGTIEIDRERVENSAVTARIAVRSIDTGIAKRDDHLRSAEFFDVAKFPEITFKSRSVKKTGPQSGDITGDFTMHGVTRSVTLHVRLLSPAAGDIKQSHWQVTTEPLKRRDFGLMFGATAETVSGIGQEVAVNIDVNAVRPQ
jgi:polyisoprenoid-binding protein YceI